jgi:tRNA(Ile)-lysidine synthase TilS/MesJ
LNVDHQFQPCSSEMSLKTAKISHSLGIPHETLQVPWGSPPYTAKPSLGQSFEEIARDARYTLLLSAMCRHGSDAIASGHHADDQSEILLMRLENGTGFFGLGGMKPFRRFGMGEGSPGQMGCYGVDGMQRWILRPMLGVSKVDSSLYPPSFLLTGSWPCRIVCLRLVKSVDWST